MIRSVFLALALLGAPLSYAAPLASPYSISIYPAQTFTATGQTGQPIQLNGLVVPSTVGSSFASGTITVTGTSLTTATFSVQGSSDGGTTYFALPIINPLIATPTTPATTVTATINGTYLVSLGGITHIKFVTSGTFTATALSLTLTASPNAQVSRNSGTGGSFTPPSGTGNLAYMTPDGSSGDATLRAILPSDLPTTPVFTSSANGLVPASGGGTANFLRADGSFAPPPGSVSAGTQGQPAGYNASGSALAPLPKFFYVNAGMTLTQINALFAVADSSSVVIIGQGVPQYNWNNVHSAQVKDLRMGADWLYPAAYGVPCDGGEQFLTISSGSNTITMSNPVVGKTLWFGYQTGLSYQAPQYTWFPSIISVAGSVATLSGHAPFAYSGWVTVGTDATTSVQAMLNGASFIFPVRLPTQCQPVVQALTWKANNFIGQNQLTSQFIGVPGQDILTAPNSSATSQGLNMSNIGFTLDESIDPTLGYISYDTTGVTPTTVDPIYRPLLNNTQNVNRQTSDQWVTNGSNGVASITASSAVICIPTALGRTATNGYNIVFPYLPIAQLFSTSVLNQTGSGCPGGNIGVTLNAPLPAGTTAAQAYWEAGTAFETGETTIPTSITYPLTITVSLPSAPDPQGTMAGHGHVILGNGSVRLEADYLGNNYAAVPGTAQIVLRRGPATISSALTAAAYTIIPTNPCAARFETPPPVQPNLNSGSVTPAGAVDFPGGCGGNGAITFPSPDALTISTGVSSALIDNIMITSTPNSFQGANSSMGVYAAGDATGYSSTFRKLNIEGTQFGFVQGPAALNNWNIAGVGPTSSGMTLEDCQIHAAYPIVLVDFQDGRISRCDTYTNYVNPYDGTEIGPATAIVIGFTTNEQTGGGVTGTSNIHVDAWFSEPHTGNGAEFLAYADIRSTQVTFDTVNFEGRFLVLKSNRLTIMNSSYGLPVLDYGTGTRFLNTYSGNATFYMTNNWADNFEQFFHWGSQDGSCQTKQAGQGPNVNCGVGYHQGYEGHNLVASLTGNDVAPFENELGGQILMSERANVGPVFLDSTEPYWGAYNTCPGVTFCVWDFLEGSSGSLYVGPHNRLAAIPYVLKMRVRTPAGANGFDIQFGTRDDGRGTCGSTGNFGYVAGKLTTTGWTIVEIPADLTGKQGCVLTWQTQQYLSVAEFDFGEINFVPDTKSTTYAVPADSIYNTSCSIPGKEYGTSATGYKYVCVAGTIKRFGPAS